MRRVHEHRRAGVNGAERIDDADGVRDGREVALLAFVDDQPQRLDFRSARRHGHHGLDVVEAALAAVSTALIVSSAGIAPAGSVGRSGGRELSKRAGSPRPPPGTAARASGAPIELGADIAEEGATGPLPYSPSSAVPTSASPRWSTGSSVAARPSSRTCPGVTRDRVPYDAQWNGRRFTVVDTGGWDPDARGLAEQISLQAEIAVSLADAVLFVVDAGVGITDADETVVKILRRSRASR